MTTTPVQDTLSTAGLSIDQALARAEQIYASIQAYVPPVPPAPVPEVTDAEFTQLQAYVESIKTKASSDIVALSDRLTSSEAADKTEDDKQTADLVALANKVAALPASPGGSGSPSPDNSIDLDAFSGTDDEKLTAALVVAQASNPKRPIRLRPRAHTFTKTRTTFSGLRILGPNVGWQNPEIANTGGALPQCSVTLNCGVGSNSWLVGTATTYDVTVAGICFKSSNANTQFYHHPYSAGTSYATHLDNLTFYGFKHILGMPGDAFSMTLNTWSGIWTVVAVQDTQFSLRGSDNWLCPDSMNYGWAGANGGKYLMRFENLSKTSVKNLYLTARGGSRAILVQGPANQQGGLDFSDCVVEGQNLNDPAMGALIVVEGGGVSFSRLKLNFGMANPASYTDRRDTAFVMVLGGVCILDIVWSGKASAAPTAPVVAVSGGLCIAGKMMGVQPLGDAIKSVRTGGTLINDATVTAG